MRNNETEKTPATVQSVDRALSILEILARDGEAGVTDLAEVLGVHKSTAFRLLASLERRGLVEQDSARGRYHLGVGVLRLAGATTARLDVVQEARPLARMLAQETGETANIAVLSEGAALYLDQVTGGSSLQQHNWVGQRIPLHATSNGKVLLTGLTREEVAATVGESYRAYTSTTVTTLDALVAEVASVREQGYALVVDEFEEGLTAVAAPVHNLHGAVVASLSVSGPTFRFDDDAVESAVVHVVDAAAEVSERLGYASDRPRSAAVS